MLFKSRSISIYEQVAILETIATNNITKHSLVHKYNIHIIHI